MAVTDGRDLERAEPSLLLWILVWSELAVFTVLLIAFLVMSLIYRDMFAEARIHLDARLASVNTLVLLVSGWQAAEAARSSKLASIRLHLCIAAGLGLVFAAIKFLEYAAEWPFVGLPHLQSFFEIYFLITGFHLVHVVFLAALMTLIAWRPKPESVAAVTLVWHVVDLVWLVIFPVVYLG